MNSQEKLCTPSSKVLKICNVAFMRTLQFVWCFTCIFVFVVYVHTSQVHQAVEKHGCSICDITHIFWSPWFGFYRSSPSPQLSQGRTSKFVQQCEAEMGWTSINHHSWLWQAEKPVNQANTLPNLPSYCISLNMFVSSYLSCEHHLKIFLNYDLF